MKAKRHFATYLQKRDIEVALRTNMKQVDNGFYEYIDDMNDEKIAQAIGPNITGKMVLNMRHTIGFKTRAARHLVSQDIEQRVEALEKIVSELREANEKMTAKLAEFEGLL